MAHPYIDRKAYELCKLGEKALMISKHETDSAMPLTDTEHHHVGAVRRVYQRADLWRERGGAFDKAFGGELKGCCRGHDCFLQNSSFAAGNS